jgi:deoxyribonuclease II
MRAKRLVQVLLILASEARCDALQCLDNDGHTVDWWFMYKAPDGYKFSYGDPDTGDASTPLAMYPRLMNDTDNPVAITRTLQALAENNETRVRAYAPGPAAAAAGSSASPSYFLYNDQPDIGTASETYGHTKGVVAAGADHKSGLWIVHSTPHWPASTGKAKFYFPAREIRFGQTFLCMSLDEGELDAVGLQQVLMRPFVYHQTGLFNDRRDAIAAVYPNLAKVLFHEWDTSPGTRIQKFNIGSSMQDFTSLAKNKEWGGDIWEGLVAPHYKSGFLVESWMRGQELGPYCPPDQEYVVVDARTLYVTENHTNFTWTETRDHAKWGVALDSSFKICVGDLNRMLSQRNRGGGVVCFSSRSLCYGMYRTVITSDVCNQSDTAPMAKAGWQGDAERNTVARWVET